MATTAGAGDGIVHFFLEPEPQVRLSCFEAGETSDGSGLPALVLLPALTGSARHFLEALLPLAAETKLLAIDWRGHGKSSAEHGFRLARLAADVLMAVRERLGGLRVCFLGHSIGSGVMWSLLENFGGELSPVLAGVAILDQPPAIGESPTTPSDYKYAVFPVNDSIRMTARVAAGREQMVDEFRRVFATGMVHSSEALDHWLSFTAGCNPDAVAGLCWDSHTSDWTDAVRRINTLVLVIGGDASFVPTGALEWLAQNVPNGAHLAIMPGGTHCPHLQPELNSAILDLLRQLLKGSLDVNVQPVKQRRTA